MKISQVSQGDLGNTDTKSLNKNTQKYNYSCTLNNWTQEEYDKIISYVSQQAKKYIIGKEVGEQGTPHLQFYISLKTKQYGTKLKSDIGIDRIHFEASRGNDEQNYKYCSKDGDFVSAGFKIKLEPDIITELYPFQKSIIDIVNGPVEKGKIHWIYDKVGQLGKTELCRYMNYHMNAPFSYGGKCADIINLAFNSKEYLQCSEKPIFVYNFGRDVDPDHISYKSMEQVADGAISNTKFEANCFLFRKPHVIVLANCKPNFDKLTKSRWILYKISPKDLTLYKVVTPDNKAVTPGK